jgi:hypothetical protein
MPRSFAILSLSLLVPIAALVAACQWIAGTSKSLPGPAGDGGSGCVTDADCNAAGACGYSRCDTSTRECTDATHFGDYLFARTRVDLGGATIACKSDLSPCITVRYPFLYVGTDRGPMRATISNPSASSVVAAPIDGAPALPTYLAGSGATVYFTNDFVAPDGGGSALWQLSWLTSFDAPIGIAQINAPQDAVALLPEGIPPSNDLLVFALIAGRGWGAAAPLSAPIDKDAVFQSSGFGGIQGTPVAISGTRTLFHSQGQTMSAFHDRFAFADSLGTTQGHALAAATDITWTSGGASSFAVGDDGSIMWLTTVVPDPMNGLQTAARFWWLVDGFASLLTDDSHRVDIVSFTPPAPPGVPVLGAVAWTNPTTAVAFAQDSASQQAQISVVSRASLPPAVVESSRRVENLPLGGTSTIVSSHGYAYVVSVEGAGSALRVRALAPSCASP